MCKILKNNQRLLEFTKMAKFRQIWSRCLGLIFSREILEQRKPSAANRSNLKSKNKARRKNEIEGRKKVN